MQKRLQIKDIKAFWKNAISKTPPNGFSATVLVWFLANIDEPPDTVEHPFSPFWSPGTHSYPSYK